MRIEGSEVCISTQKESYRSWYFRNVRSCGIYTSWCFKIIKGLVVVMKGVHRNNLYYLKGSIITGQVEISISSDHICTQVWQMRVGHGGEKSLQAPIKKGSLEGASICNLELGEHGGLDKKKMKFSTTNYNSESLLDCVHVSIWGPAWRS